MSNYTFDSIDGDGGLGNPALFYNQGQLNEMAEQLRRISALSNKTKPTATDKIDLAAANKAFGTLQGAGTTTLPGINTTSGTSGSGGSGNGGGGGGGGGSTTRTVVGNFTDANGNLIYVWSDGTTSSAGINDGRQAAKRDASKSAWNVLNSTFDQYGLGALAGVVKGMIEEGASEAEMLLGLRNSDVYKKRFSANEARVKAGLRALSEAEYIGLEDAYANTMRRYGLPDWYTQQGELGKQANLEQFIANDVSPAELEDRIQLAVNRVQNGPKEVMQQLSEYFPNITQGDVLAYVLDPKKALPVLQRQIQTAEIGGEAKRYGLNTGFARADELAGLGVTQQQARQGYQAIGGGLERGRQLGNLYGENYDQNTAEQEVFGLNDANAAARKRKKITQLEQAQFGGSTGISGGAFEQNRAGAF